MINMQLIDIAAVCLAFVGGFGIASGVLITSVPLSICGSILTIGTLAIVIYRYCKLKKEQKLQYESLPSDIY